MKRRKRGTDPAQIILDAALREADRVSWQSLRLHVVAESLGMKLDELYRHYRDADALAEAWLSVADRAMLAAAAAPGFRRRPLADRLARTMMAWLDALAAHREVTAQMLLGKLYPGHPHHLFALVFRLSRTVQWWREAALLDAPPPRRQIEEVGLTWIFVATVTRWATDRTEDQMATRKFLARLLEGADNIVPRLKGFGIRRRAD
jgi:AcrR family transcriptional regulator